MTEQEYILVFEKMKEMNLLFKKNNFVFINPIDFVIDKNGTYELYLVLKEALDIQHNILYLLYKIDEKFYSDGNTYYLNNYNIRIPKVYGLFEKLIMSINDEDYIEANKLKKEILS